MTFPKCALSGARVVYESILEVIPWPWVSNRGQTGPFWPARKVDNVDLGIIAKMQGQIVQSAARGRSIEIIEEGIKSVWSSQQRVTKWLMLRRWLGHWSNTGGLRRFWNNISWGRLPQLAWWAGIATGGRTEPLCTIRSDDLGVEVVDESREGIAEMIAPSLVQVTEKRRVADTFREETLAFKVIVTTKVI